MHRRVNNTSVCDRKAAFCCSQTLSLEETAEAEPFIFCSDCTRSAQLHYTGVQVKASSHYTTFGWILMSLTDFQGLWQHPRITTKLLLIVVTDAH